MHDVVGRERKARTMVSILEDFIQKPLKELCLLNVGGSAGIIDNYLADYFKSVISIDIDELAIKQAKEIFSKENLDYQQGDAVNLQFEDNSFDVVVCSQVYEHVPSAEKMMAEISRVLVPGGICYFAASNRIMWNEPHYNLPLLSVIPRRLAHIYIRWAKKADYYHELHYSYWGLKKLVKSFYLHDYTEKVLHDPVKFGIDYMVKPGSAKATIAKIISSKFVWFSPGYIWLLEKPSK
jgi:2-polyprenyl-3-methyl-5-hydroxy-6-metoxy-1,4-benzoquinol methylase